LAFIIRIYKVCLKSNETGAIKFFLLTTELQINIIPFKVVHLGSHTPLETLLQLPVAVLEVFMWKCPQLLCHDLSDVVHSSKMTTFEVEFEFLEKEEVTWTQIRQAWG
jgi:hypothetical protein